jgi:hypothetical protein
MKKLHWLIALAVVGGIAVIGIAGVVGKYSIPSAAAQNGPDKEKIKEMAKQALRMQLGREPTQAELDQIDKAMNAAAARAPSRKAKEGNEEKEKAAQINVPPGTRIVRGNFKQTLENGTALFDAEDSFEVVVGIDQWGGIAYANFEDKNPATDGPLTQSDGAAVNHPSKSTVRDERQGCPAPKAMGPVEVLTIKKMSAHSKNISLYGTQSIPAVVVGKGKGPCEGATETLSEEPRDISLGIPIERELLAESATKTVSISLPYYPGWKFSIGPYDKTAGGQ